MHLTERTVTSINFDTAKTKDKLRQLTKSLVLTIRINNSNLDELYNTESNINTKEEIKEESLPREIDSVRDLMIFALMPFDSDYAYLETEVEIHEGSTGGIRKYEFKNLFVTKYEEHFAKDERDTIIKIKLRELER